MFNFFTHNIGFFLNSRIWKACMFVFLGGAQIPIPLFLLFLTVKEGIKSGFHYGDASKPIRGSGKQPNPAIVEGQLVS